jgi:spore coat polysaccharide biosynthesis predicted glycosyltransferase SpsG
MRCLALAHAAERLGMRPVFAGAIEDPGVAARIARAGFATRAIAAGAAPDEDLQTTLAAAPGGCIVVDGYGFGVEYLRALATAGRRVAVIDDLGQLSEYPADLVVNQNPGAKEIAYHVQAGTHCLLGTQYALLRPEFERWRDWQRTTRAVAERVLVTLGGGDVGLFLAFIVDALAAISRPLEVRLIAAGGAHRREIESACERALAAGHRLTQEDFSDDMPGLLAWADIAVSGAGSTCWELAYMRTPAVLLTLAGNQRANAVALDELGVAVDMGPVGQLERGAFAQSLAALAGDAGRRERMSQAGRALVDGRGAERVARAITELPA